MPDEIADLPVQYAMEEERVKTGGRVRGEGKNGGEGEIVKMKIVSDGKRQRGIMIVQQWEEDR